MRRMSLRGARGFLGITTAVCAVFAGVVWAGDIELPPILPPGGPRAASELTAETACDPEEVRTGTARLTWTVAEQSGERQEVHVTILREGFETGQFVSSGPLSSGETSFDFSPSGQALHRWRVLTLHEDGFVPSETATFTGPLCVSDEVQESPPPGPD